MVLVAGGCAGKKTALPPAGNTHFTPVGIQEPAPVPENTVAGKVIRVEAPNGFVVVSFRVGHLPAPERRLSLYRRGAKAGEIKVNASESGNDQFMTADILSGDAEVGDEVREQ